MRRRHAPSRAAARATRRLRRSAALLLLTEIVLQLLVALRALRAVDWAAEVDLFLPSAAAFDAAGVALPTLMVALLTAIAALLTLTGRRLGWLLAMLAQTLTLAGGLFLYFRHAPWTVYPLLGWAVFMTLYLNSADIRALGATPVYAETP